MSLIVVEGHKIDTKNITKITDSGWRRCGFKIHLIGPKVITIDEEEPYNMTPGDISFINDAYRELREKIEKKWKEDKSELDMYNLQ